ncbi:MAG TPA: metallophosphoesterase [Methylocella sp.]|nr:metallophosphoesterase [Methylocella sp.]
MATYFTSDHHFGHGGALGLYRRPFASVVEMDAQMIDRWNAVVGPADEVWHLGDFALRPKPSRLAFLLDALNGHKHLVYGNNDDAAVIAHSGWESTEPYRELVIDGQPLVLCHYPFRTWRNMNKGWINLHGHSHGRLKSLPRQFDVGVEVWNFRPVQIDELMKRSRSTVQAPA